MYAFIAIPILCWLCVLLARPRRPRAGDEAGELAYVRALGRRQWLAFAAIALTVAALVAVGVLSRGVGNRETEPVSMAESRLTTPDARLPTPQAAPPYCVGPANGPPICFRVERDGTWTRMELRDGQWVPAASVMRP
jgi:hypothetical protein